jgi:hypothetical protein
MTKKNDIVIVSKEKAFWLTSINELKQAIEMTENKLKWEKACLCMAKAHELKTK